MSEMRKGVGEPRKQRRGYGLLRTIVDDYGTLDYYRWCVGCGSWLPTEFFSKGSYRCNVAANGCRAAYDREWRLKNLDRIKEVERQRRERLSADPEWRAKRAKAQREGRDKEKQRASRRKAYRAIMADPERHRKYLEMRRLQYRLRAERKGIAHVPQRAIKLRYPFTRKRTKLPIEPIRQWLHEKRQNYGSWEALALACGYESDKNLRVLTHEGTADVEFETVDRILVAEGSTLMEELYPAEYDALLAA